MCEMESTLEFINSRLDNAREKVNKLKNIEIRSIIQSKTRKLDKA